MASTTFLRTVPLIKWMMVAGILVKKLHMASLPTAMIGGMCNPKMSRGSSSTPPPRPVIPISVPTVKPISIFSSKNSMPSFESVLSSRFPVLSKTNRVKTLRTRDRTEYCLLSVAVGSDKALALKVQNDGLRRFLGAQFGRVNHDFGISGRLVGVRDAGKFLNNAGASLGVQAFAIALFTDINGSGGVHQYETAKRFDHLAHRLTRRRIRRNRSADGDAAVLGDFGGDVADASNVDVAMLLGESEFRRQVLAHEITIQQG